MAPIALGSSTGTGATAFTGRPTRSTYVGGETSISIYAPWVALLGRVIDATQFCRFDVVLFFDPLVLVFLPLQVFPVP